MSKNAPVPDADVLGRFATVAAATARGHLQAAECLLQGGFWGQAHSIAVIGFEEAGKAWLCTIAMLSPDELRQEFSFGDLGRDHRSKLSAARSVSALLAFVRGGQGAPLDGAEALADLDALAREDDQGKQRGLYTDYVDGAVRSPGSVTEDQARAMVAVVEDVVDNAGALVSLATAMWAADNIPLSVLSFLRQAADAAQAGGDAMTMFMQDELQMMEPLAGLLQGDPEWMRDILAAAEKLGKVGAPQSGESSGDGAERGVGVRSAR